MNRIRFMGYFLCYSKYKEDDSWKDHTYVEIGLTSL